MYALLFNDRYLLELVHMHLLSLQPPFAMMIIDGCHLRKYSRNPVRAKLTDVATRMSRWNIVIDKMHFSGHSDPWCRENCNPNNVKELDKV